MSNSELVDRFTSKPIPQNSPLSLEDWTMLDNIAYTADTKITGCTKDQRLWIESEKGFYRWVSTRLWYLQEKQLGYINEDPTIFITGILESSIKPIELTSNFYFTLLQVLIHGWEHIKFTSDSNHKVFNFKNPRELLSKIVYIFS